MPAGEEWRRQTKTNFCRNPVGFQKNLAKYGGARPVQMVFGRLPNRSNGSANSHKTQEGMPYGDYNTDRADTQILFRAELRLFDQCASAPTPGDDFGQLHQGEQWKMVDYAETGTAHRTTCGHFPEKGKWDDKRLEETQIRKSFQTISKLSHNNGIPVFVSIDDTVLPKTVPFSKSKRPTQGAEWHYSHLEEKVIYGYQIHAAIVGTGDASLCYSLKRCCPEHGTKIDMTLDIIRSLPDHAGTYVRMDNWYTNLGVIDTCREKGCHLIGAMKTNRILYPEGKRISAANLASTLALSCYRI